MRDKSVLGPSENQATEDPALLLYFVQLALHKKNVYVLYIRSSRMSELPTFVYIKSRVILHVKFAHVSVLSETHS